VGHIRLIDATLTDRYFMPIDIQTGSVNDRQRSLADFWPDPVTDHQRDTICHAFSINRMLLKTCLCWSTFESPPLLAIP